MDDQYANLPDFDSLPPVEGMPQGCAWGVFDRGGQNDTLGCLNLLTPAVVRAAYAEARDGVSISLNHGLELVQAPVGRAQTAHRVLSWAHDIAPAAMPHIHALDDELTFNTQTSSQWDGFLHYAHQASGLGYNGVRVAKRERGAGDGGATTAATTTTTATGLECWHGRGGIVGRGVLLDYRAYAQAKGITYEVCGRHAITVQDLEAVAEFQGTELKRGDILIIRSGIAEELVGLSGEEQMAKMMKGGGGMIGVEGTTGAAKWFWNKHFAAVAGDMLAFEVFPPQKPDGTFGDMGDLTMFGLNIGELWDLKGLAEHCAKIGRYSFLLTSIPLNVPGLVASPPNALALF